MDENINFASMDSWRGGSAGKFGLTFKQIVILHINRCVINGSVEWHGGYWNETGYNPTIRTYVPNSRETYCNSVRQLRALLLGYYDEKIKNEDKKLKEEHSKTYKEFEEKTKSKGEERKEVVSDWRSFDIDWHIRLFEQLIMLSKRLNFFEEETSEEEM